MLEMGIQRRSRRSAEQSLKLSMYGLARLVLHDMGQSPEGFRRSASVLMGIDVCRSGQLLLGSVACGFLPAHIRSGVGSG